MPALPLVLWNFLWWCLCCYRFLTAIVSCRWCGQGNSGVCFSIHSAVCLHLAKITSLVAARCRVNYFAMLQLNEVGKLGTAPLCSMTGARLFCSMGWPSAAVCLYFVLSWGGYLGLKGMWYEHWNLCIKQLKTSRVSILKQYQLFSSK